MIAFARWPRHEFRCVSADSQWQHYLSSLAERQSNTNTRPPAMRCTAGAYTCGAIAQRERGGVNIILVISDSLRKDHLGCYGTEQASSWFTSHGGRPVETPNLDRLAGEGTLFEQAYPESMATIQVRRALHTGLR